MRLDESDIDLHGWLRAFYSCGSLGRSFVMDHSVQRPLPSYANFFYGKANYSSILKEVLNPLGLKLVQGKWIDAVVPAPPASEPSPRSVSPAAPPAPLAGALAGGGGIAGGVAPVSSDSASSDSVVAPVPRRFRARASGLSKSSARRMGFSYSELLATASASGFEQLWSISALASDSVGSMDFARIVDFSAFDSARVVFGSEVRRPESTLNYENGSAITNYSSLFDGLTVALSGERWSFVWRGSGSVLEVPGSLGSCASGSSNISGESVSGVPFLSSVPFLRYFFSSVSKYSDDLLVSVCVEELIEEASE